MRGRKRIISVVFLFSVVLIVSMVLASGLVDVPLMNLLAPEAGPLSTAPISVYPSAVIKDHLLLPEGATFFVHVNISDVSDLFTWQLNVTWNKALLNASRIVTGNNATYILYQTGSANKTASFKLGWVINATDNAKGDAGIADTILDNRAPPTGVTNSSWNRMVSIEFKVVGYGACNLTISSTGNLQTKLLDSANPPNIIAYASTNGYFRNALNGDANIDKAVNVFDIGAVKSRWGTTPASLNWIREYDVNNDNVINIFDIGLVKTNWGRTA